MEFLYGDSTPSPLTSNVLEFLRDAIDFGVFALQVDDELSTLRDRAQATSRASDEEIERLEALGRAVAGAIDGAPKGGDESDTARCAIQLTAAAEHTIGVAVAAAREKLQGLRSELGSEEDVQRASCFKALETLLVANSPPTSTVSVHVERGANRGYSAWRLGQTDFELAWRIELGIPHGHLFAGEGPMEKLASQVEIHAPEQAGWIKKGVKLKAQRLDKLVLKELVDDGRTVTLKLRTDGAGASGFDFVVDPKAGTVAATRAGADGDPSAGSFDLATEDVAGIVAVAERARNAAADLTATTLVEATLEEREIRQEPAFAALVGQLIALMAPIVQEISRHSLTPTELVLRRLITSERREEIFVAKATLLEKVAALRPELRGLFGRLGLETVAPPTSAIPEENGWGSGRAELPRSDPPPKPSRPPPR